jgi:DNA replication protein DnaC
LVIGPVGTGKTHLAAALGHIAVRRRVACLSTRLPISPQVALRP